MIVCVRESCGVYLTFCLNVNNSLLADFRFRDMMCKGERSSMDLEADLVPSLFMQLLTLDGLESRDWVCAF